jgi:hypothetical protein
VTLAVAALLVSVLGTLGAALALLAGTSVAAGVRTITLWFALAAFQPAGEAALASSERA